MLATELPEEATNEEGSAEKEMDIGIENIFSTQNTEPGNVEEKLEELNEQGRDAQYSFGYRVQDEIKDNYMERQEEREDGVVRGHYAYSDGYFHRSVTYIADKNGFRVTEMKVLSTILY